jgi:hypothetical protein
MQRSYWGLLLATCGACWVPAVLFSAESEQGAMEGKARLMSKEELDQSPEAAEMRKRLADPQERKRVWAEQRAGIPEQYPDLAHVLLLDATKEAALIDLLTDQQMQNLDRFYELQSAKPTTVTDSRDSLQSLADEETRKITQLRELLGPEGHERYRQYMKTWSARREAVYFEARLDPAYKLSEDQKTRLIELLHEHREAELNLMSRRSFPPTFGPSSEAELQKHQVQMNEDTLRQMVQSSQELLKKLPALLTPQQLEAYEKMEARKLDAQRKHVQQMRISAGLSPEIPDRAESPSTAEPAPCRPVVGRIQFVMRVNVNQSEPVEISRELKNGEVTSFEGPEGLWLEAKPTLYEDGWLDVELAYYERGPDERRVLLSKSQMGTRTRPGKGPAGGGGSTLVGSKGYAVWHFANATRIQ